ncbi:Uma2 family endonuclease [Picosynechococcus sp. NKBG15041c]|uniref:Uma2 family endonuclease n=1 Tax=Picosynechococcus sp. NKBG15041c TaxID=1407650 RepID=UPI00046339EC|nr:Uma2 family endonuclease [Picosynechococcus sp. NKBG15041c]
MVALTTDHYLSPEEYLALEQDSDIRHEYMHGEVYAMAGATRAHNTLSLNLAIALRNHLNNSPCRTYMADVKVRLSAGKKFFYPDLIVSCDDNDELSLSYVTEPRVIIEVLSESTEGFDRGNKFKFYRTIPSLQEYVLVSTTQYSVDCFRRGEGDLWILESYQGQEALLKLQSLDLEISLADIYATVTLPETDDDLEGDFSE